MKAVGDAFGEYDDRVIEYSIVNDYSVNGQNSPFLNAIVAEFRIIALKDRKLLITVGVYSTELPTTFSNYIKNTLFRKL